MVKVLKKLSFILLFMVICFTFIPVSATGNTSYIELANGNGYVTYRNSSEKVEVNSEYVYEETEFRAVWVTALSGNIAKFSSEAQYKKEILSILDTMEYYNMNAMIFHIRIMNDAFYKSQYNKWSSYYNTDPSWEALPWIIDECHRRGIEFHAWMNPYRVTNAVSRELSDIAAEFPSNNPASDPNNLLKGENSVILNPGSPVVKDFLVKTVMEVVMNYDVDAIHFDDYFYDKGVDDTTTRAQYNTSNLSLGDFRRKQVDDFIQSLYNSMTTYNRISNRCVQLGISPSGVWKSGNGIVTYDNEGNAITTGSNTSPGAFAHYDNYLYSDTLKWINNEWIDYILPQTYWAIEHTSCPYADLMKWWNDVVRYKDVSLYSGMAVYQAYSEGGSSWFTNDKEAYNEAMICNTLENVDGISVYDYEYLEKTLHNTKGFVGMKDIWNKPTILPEIKSEEPVTLDPINNLTAQVNPVGNLLSWDDNADAKFYVIYRSEQPLTYDVTEVVDVIGHLAEDGKVEFTDMTAEKGKKYYYGVRAQSRTLTLNSPVFTELDLNPTDKYATLGEFYNFNVTEGIVPGSNITIRFNELNYPFGNTIKYSVSYAFNGATPIVVNTFDKDNGDFVMNLTVPYDANRMYIELKAENNVGRTVEIIDTEIVKGLGKINGFTFDGKEYTNSEGSFSWQSFDESDVIYWVQYSTDLVKWRNEDYVLHSGKSVLSVNFTLPKEKGRIYYRVFAEKGEDAGYSDVYAMDLVDYLGDYSNMTMNSGKESILFIESKKTLEIKFDQFDVSNNISYGLYVSTDLETWIAGRTYNSKVTVTYEGDQVIIKLPFTYEKLKLYVKVVTTTSSGNSESDIMVVYVKSDGAFFAEMLPFMKDDLTGFMNEMNIFN